MSSRGRRISLETRLRHTASGKRLVAVQYSVSMYPFFYTPTSNKYNCYDVLKLLADCFKLLFFMVGRTVFNRFISNFWKWCSWPSCGWLPSDGATGWSSRVSSLVGGVPLGEVQKAYPYSKAGHTPGQNGWSTLKGCILVVFVHPWCDEASVCLTPVSNLDSLGGVRCFHALL